MFSQIMTNSSESTEARIASVHALRRILLHYVESGWFHRQPSSSDKSSAKKADVYNKWFQGQYASIKDGLIQLLSEDEAYHAVAVRTYTELMKVDVFVEEGPSSSPRLLMESFKALIFALVISKNEIDVDLLLMIKDEIISLHDCDYYAMLVLKEMIVEVKDMYQSSIDRAGITKKNAAAEDPILSNFDTIRKNLIDMMRIISVPSDIDTENVLVPLVAPSKGGKEGDGDSDGEDESSDEESEEKIKARQKEALLSKMDPLLAELAGLNSASSGRGAKRGLKGSAEGVASKRSRPEVTMFEKLQDVDYYKKAFSKAWLALLSLPFTAAQHKLLLKHLPEHVVPNMRNPMLLADYLTQSYATGGMVAVLALESLFHLIVHNNLDYPDFFLSLYNLCTVEVFSAKYRAKFMKLLSTSLKSVNLPAYLVAAFCKRLASLALHSPTPNSQFCIAQVTWLLRQHPQAQVLIHRKIKASAPEPAGTFDKYDAHESRDLERAHALQSSLWEMEALQNHHVYAASALAQTLATAESTLVTAQAGNAYVHVEDYLNIGYADMMDSAMGKGVVVKRTAALAYIKPTSVYSPDSLMDTMFTLG